MNELDKKAAFVAGYLQGCESAINAMVMAFQSTIPPLVSDTIQDIRESPAVVAIASKYYDEMIKEKGETIET